MNNRNMKLMSLDAFASVMALYFSFLIRFDFSIPPNFLKLFFDWVPWFVILQIFVFYFADLYARMWRYTSLFDLYAILFSVTLVSAISVIFVFIFSGSQGYPRSVLLMYYILNSLATVAIRLSVRVYYTHYHQESPFKNTKAKKVLLLIGAGKTGEKIAREIMTTSRHQYSIAGFIDDNVEKHGALLHGKKIFCGIGDLPNLKIKFDELLITAPTASGDQIRRIVDICKQTGKKYKIVPGINEIIDGEVSMAAVRDVSYSDLLGREEVKLDMNSIEDILKDKRVLITGAGGSIGSELVRQLLRGNPKKIILFEISEINLYSIQSEIENIISSKELSTEIISVLGDIKDKHRIMNILTRHKVDFIYHAAAYKHVPIVEYFENITEGIKNNIFGTKVICDSAARCNVKQVVVISTDKAVRPTNIMGASKRLAEMVVQSANKQSAETKFCMVRFGNVINSSGSVIPLFRKQISNGGPLTITHKDVTRFFMTISEASSLVIQAGEFSDGGEVFILDMGEQVRILDLAKKLIYLSGMSISDDDSSDGIKIKEVGLRPGEKLYEELLISGNEIKTPHEKIFKSVEGFISGIELTKVLNKLEEKIISNDTDGIKDILKQNVEGYEEK